MTRAENNVARLALCDPDAVPRFAAALGRVLAYMDYGDDPKAWAVGGAYFEINPWRTAEQQQAKKDAGFSRTLASAHCHTREVGNGGVVPASRAIHIIGGKPGPGGLYDLPAMFWLHVGAAALKEGLLWGGLYPPKSRNKDDHAYFEQIKKMLRAALWDERWDEALHLWSKRADVGEWGWDPAHIEWRPA